MSVSAQQVKALRDRTGAGMMDCKSALVEAEGNEEKAIEIIQKKGLAKIAKKAGAIAAEGKVHSYIHAGSRVGVLVEVNCQTDFAARNEDFQTFCDNLGMHIASEKPECVTREELDEKIVAKQKEIFLGQLKEEEEETGKKRPEAALGKIIEGKINKWMKEAVLLDQVYILAENKETIGDVLETLTAKIGEKIAVRRFVRYELGEGIEKKQENFAEEVAKQLSN